MLAEPRTWRLGKSKHPLSDHWTVKPKREQVFDYEEVVEVVELEPILDMLEATAPADGRSWTLAPDPLVAVVRAFLESHGRLNRASSASDGEGEQDAGR